MKEIILSVLMFPFFLSTQTQNPYRYLKILDGKFAYERVFYFDTLKADNIFKKIKCEYLERFVERYGYEETRPTRIKLCWFTENGAPLIGDDTPKRLRKALSKVEYDLYAFDLILNIQEGKMTYVLTNIRSETNLALVNRQKKYNGPKLSYNQWLANAPALENQFENIEQAIIRPNKHFAFLESEFLANLVICEN